MLLSELVDASERVAQTSRRLEKTSTLAACLRQLVPEEIEIGVAFLSGETRQRRIGIGPALLREVRSEGATTPSLELAAVDGALSQLAETVGSGSSALRSRLLKGLFARATHKEQDFLLRLLLGELRQGALEGLMVEAVAQAASLPVIEVRRATMLAGDLAGVARVALSAGSTGLGRFSIQLFRPVQPMLAQPVEEIAHALKALGTAALEWKLDGARVQVHKANGSVRVFSRGLNEVTHAVPEIAAAVAQLPAREIILDGEAIALKADATPQPFQVTMRRFGRKLDVARLRETLPLSVYFFDCLHLDGEPLIDQTAASRFEALAAALPEALVIPRLVTDDLAQAQAFFQAALRQGHEGIMAKSLDASYLAGNRGSSWLKLKQAQTLDLVVLAAEWGNGRRRGWLSNLHLGARDAATGEYVMLGKTFKGMTDAMLAWQTDTLLKLELHRDAYTVYVRPELVVEIAFNDLQASSQYPGGLALRFARIKRYRTDKKASDADSIDTVRAVFAQQIAQR